LILLQGGVQCILAWLESKSLQPHLRKDLKLAKVLRGVLGDLKVHEEEEKVVPRRREKLAV